MDILRPYPEYKDSGMPWLGKIPSHWELLRSKYIFREVDIRSITGEETHLSMSQKYGLIESSKIDNLPLQSESYIGGKLCKKNDLVLNRLKAHLGVFACAPTDGVVSPDYSVFRIRRDVEVRFFELVLKTPTYISELRRSTKGIVEGFWRLYTDDFYNIRLPVPPSNEQQVILRWFDHVDNQVRHYIRAKQNLIKLLEEQKQAIIHRAVTRGLDPNVSLKPSGVEWLGDISEHWDVLPFTKCVTERSDYRGATPEKVESGIFLVTAKNIGMGTIDYDVSKEYVRCDQYQKIMRRGLPKLGDLLLTTEAPLGHVAMTDREDVAFAQRIIRFRMNRTILLPKFTLYALMSYYFQGQLLLRATGSTAKGIKASKLPQLLILCPPIEEQIGIINWIDHEVKLLDHVIHKTRYKMDLLREYRTRLISDVVTGKLDVRSIEIPAANDTEAIAEWDNLLDSEVDQEIQEEVPAEGD